MIGSLAAASATVAKREPRREATREKDSRGVVHAIARAPLKTRRWQSPYNDDPSAILAGKKLFRHHCAECHGDDARGNLHAANLRAPGVQRATPGELEWLLWNGNLAKGMPSWSGLPPQRRWQIVAYLKSLR
ncbi:MAG TPA: c-type cytochrome [Candidatus Dormibacteraeota bacterium]|nr:c-type cytochrome [Candidatus Dormibacteraeota bacterium]